MRMDEVSEGFVADLHVLASVCVRQRLSVHSLCVLTLLYRCGGLYVSQIMKQAGMSKSDAYNRLRFLEGKGLVRRVCERVAWRRYEVCSWELTDEGRRVIREYEVCYRVLHERMLLRQRMREL